MTKKELVKAIANIPDDAEVLFGNKEEQFIGSFADKVIYDGYNNKVLVTNKYCDPIPNEYGETIYEDKIEED